MGGLGFLFVIGIYIFIVYKMVKAAKSRWVKAVVLMAALLIPTVDAIYGRIKLNQMCETEAGLKVNRVVEHVEGFMASTAYSDYWIRKHGFRFAEDRISYGTRTTRYTLESDGEIKVEKNVIPKSQYRLRQNDFGEKEAYGHSQYLIENIATGEILATDTQVTFHGGWAERFLAKFSDAGGGNVAWCSNNAPAHVSINNLVNSTLKH